MAVKRKILYIITKSIWGGAQRYVYDLATSLDANRFDVLVACGGSGPLIERLREAGVRSVPLPHLERDVHPLQEPRTLWSLYRLFRSERPDIIHLSSSKAGGIGAMAALLYKLTAHAWGTRVIFTVHGWPFNEDRPRWQRLLIFLASWLSTLLQDRIIVITTADYRSGRRFVPERKLALIFHGTEPIDFLTRPSARTLFAERIGPIAPDDILIGANAELTKNKGLGYLIDAADQIKSGTKYKILIIGEGEERHRLEGKIQALGLGDQVFLLGFVSDAWRYLLGLDLFVLPSVKEGLPYAIMEAMAAGLPIVATRVGGIPDLVREGESGLLVPPKNPSALAEAISRLLVDRALGKRLGRSARETLARSFPIDAMVSRTTALYEAT